MHVNMAFLRVSSGSRVSDADVCLCCITGVSIPVDGGGLLTSWFNTDLQPRIAENGEDIVFGSDCASNHTAGGSKQ